MKQRARLTPNHWHGTRCTHPEQAPIILRLLELEHIGLKTMNQRLRHLLRDTALTPLQREEVEAELRYRMRMLRLVGQRLMTRRREVRAS